MKSYRIPLVWSMYGYADVAAEMLKEAIDYALGPECPLPDGNYLDESATVDAEALKEMYGEEA